MCTVKEGHDRVKWGIGIYFFFMKKLGAGSILDSSGALDALRRAFSFYLDIFFRECFMES
jgi:hypothetical protein